MTPEKRSQKIRSFSLLAKRARIAARTVRTARGTTANMVVEWSLTKEKVWWVVMWGKRAGKTRSADDTQGTKRNNAQFIIFRCNYGIRYFWIEKCVIMGYMLALNILANILDATAITRNQVDNNLPFSSLKQVVVKTLTLMVLWMHWSSNKVSQMLEPSGWPSSLWVTSLRRSLRSTLIWSSHLVSLILPISQETAMKQLDVCFIDYHARRFFKYYIKILFFNLHLYFSLFILTIK